MKRGSGLQVLVVAVNYAPEPGGTAPYTAAIADHLALIGHRVEVLTGMPHYPSWRVSADYAGKFRMREVRAGVSLRRLSHYVPARQTAVRRAIYEISFALHALISPRIRRPDVVLAVIPSIFGAAAAMLIAKTSGARLVVWVQDSVSRGAAQTGIPGGRGVARMIAAVEGLVLRSADNVICISESFCGQVKSIGVLESRVSLVRNWTHISAPTVGRLEMRRRMGWAEDELIALHAGNMGLKQGLENVVDAGRLAFAQGSNVRFILMGDGNQRAQLQARAAGVPSVSFVPPVADEEYSSMLAAADVLVVNERQGVSDMSLPSKLTSYALAGRPVMAAVQADGETAAEIARTGMGAVIDNGSPSTLLMELPRLLKNFEAAPASMRDSRSDVRPEGAQCAKDRITQIIEARPRTHA